MVARVIGAMFLGESVTPMALVGAGLVVAASMLAPRAEI
jgi:drug/metabolite transporter (DMT)-like permease